MNLKEQKRQEAKQKPIVSFNTLQTQSGKNPANTSHSLTVCLHRFQYGDYDMFEEMDGFFHIRDIEDAHALVDELTAQIEKWQKANQVSL
ncbi:hypothetical protein QQ054_00945 [Oscillatoria amoena NRMC-F 0135]|nr:hypothetical protein [Oscillatoria amoena NRMC-F 0135]